MRQLWRKYVRTPFRRALIEIPWLGPVISAILIALAVNIATEALTTWGGLAMAWVTVGVLAIATVVLVYAHGRIARSRPTGPLPGKENPDPAPGLIFMLSSADTLNAAIQYHGAALQHCFLIVTREREDEAAAAIARFPELRFSVHALPDLYDSQGCYEIVRHICRQEAPRLGLDPHAVVADITGGTKPMTLGMIVACLEGGCPMEHVPTHYDAAGQYVGPLPPIQIDVRCQIQRVP